MSEYTALYLIAMLAVALIGYLANVFAFLSAKRLPVLRLIDGELVPLSSRSFS